MNQKTINPCTGGKTCTGKEPCAGREPRTGDEPCTGGKDAAGRMHTITENRIEKHLRKTSCTNIISEDLFCTNSSCRKQICTKTFTKEFSCCMEVN